MPVTAFGVGLAVTVLVLGGLAITILLGGARMAEPTEKIAMTNLHFHLRRAQVCIDCEAVFERGWTDCPGCGSAEHLPLTKWFAALPSS